MELLNRHVTIRKFLGRKVEPKLLDLIFYSGIRASTTGNMQTYSIIVTQDEERKRKMAPLHFNQPAVISAPVLVTFVADFNRFSKWCQISKAEPGFNNFLSFFTASIDALLAAQNVCIAAEDNGLGICYLGTTTYNAREIIEELKLPPLTFPVTAVAIGYPDEQPGLTDRLPPEAVVHHEEYMDYTGLQLREFYTYKENLEEMKRFVKENNKENLAQVFTDVRYKKEDNEFFSEKMLKTLKKQGFL